MATDTILLFGANGQVGFELQRSLAPLGAVVALTRAQADLSRPDSLRALVRDYAPGVIVNAAAYTAVDRAEAEPELARCVNALAPGVLAEEAARLGAAMVHFSTDYVFDGGQAAAYVETDTPHPLSVYGNTKWAGELAVAQACPRHLIFRTSWVFGPHGGNFLKTMLRLAAERDRLRVVADQIGAPTSSTLIAATTAAVLRIMHGADAQDPRWGLYHLTAGGQASWHDYACYLIAQGHAHGLALRARPDTVAAITTADYPVAATRPANSCLNTTKLRQAFGVELPAWQVGVDAVVATLT